MSEKSKASPEKKNAESLTNAINKMKIENYFAKPGTDPADDFTWCKRTAQISNEKGDIIFEQKDVELPESWSQLATNVVVSKYFKGTLNTPERETSLRQVVDRVVNTISMWGIKDGYFASEDDGKRFRNELAALILQQRMSFNSPVWFNVGIDKNPQCSACFINSVDDTMESILELSKTEGMLFKYGSGTGTNFSSIRSSYEGMSGGGEASGPVSFMKGYDAFAGVIKSGGKTRRAAKMVILNVDHPDILQFIDSKVIEEEKAQALIKAGYDGSFNGEAYASVFFQNANHSVRVNDTFMNSVKNGEMWQTHAITTGESLGTYPAEMILDKISKAAWCTGDPGLQFDSTINDWHTCTNSGRINASNPCSEFMFLDNSACNLSSLNLMKFRNEHDEFDVEAFCKAIRVVLLAMEIIVDNASYPTPKIGKNSHKFRPLGLGYANLGALLMSRGLAYDSDQGRAYAAAVTALMNAEAYKTSAEIASFKKPFSEYDHNRTPFLRVMRKHVEAVYNIDSTLVPENLLSAVKDVSENMLSMGEKYGFRNSQVTLLAPTGTIAFMMDCDTTGIEPDIALVKYKKLVGGGMLKIVNRTVPLALKNLGYSDSETAKIIDYIDENDTIEGAPELDNADLPVFDCAFKPYNGKRFIHHMGHIRMMSAVQPFLSGAISKTVNMPGETTDQEIFSTYLTAWEAGLKAIAIYRDGCKASQPLNTSKEEEKSEPEPKIKIVRRDRIKLPDERKSITHKFSVGGHEGYITVGMYENGAPGEVFIIMSKEGSAVSGLMDSFATILSIALQHGVPLQTVVQKLTHTRFEPSGYTSNPQIPIAQSLMDYLFRWMAIKFLPEEELGFHYEKSISETENLTESISHKNNGNGNGNGHHNGSLKATNGTANNNGNKTLKKVKSKVLTNDDVMARAQKMVLETMRHDALVAENQSDAPPCPECGAILVRNGACYKCLNCGATSGCS